jgi:hypothetical protein
MKGGVEELHRCLAQARRMHAQPIDELTTSRLMDFITEIELQLAAAEAGKGDLPE